MILGGPPGELRGRHLGALTEPQELHVEHQVSGGVTWLAGEDAYAVINGTTLVERFDGLMSSSGALSVLCKSFDTLGMPRSNRFRPRHLEDYADRNGLFVCEFAGIIVGCGIANVASRRSLENAGFVSNYRLLSIKY